MKGLCVAFSAAAHLLYMARKGADKTAWGHRGYFDSWASLVPVPDCDPI